MTTDQPNNQLTLEHVCSWALTKQTFAIQIQIQNKIPACLTSTKDHFWEHPDPKATTLWEDVNPYKRPTNLPESTAVQTMCLPQKTFPPISKHLWLWPLQPLRQPTRGVSLSHVTSVSSVQRANNRARGPEGCLKKYTIFSSYDKCSNRNWLEDPIKFVEMQNPFGSSNKSQGAVSSNKFV